MKKVSEQIVFFGSGPVAAESLDLLSKEFSVEAVVTKPRPQHHRGEVPVLDIAGKLNRPVYTAQNRAELDRLFAERPFKSRLGVLIDFGIIVSQKVIDYFPLGIINSHFSLLPEWRGADPITFSILSGQKTTGVSLMLLTAGMDEGPILGATEVDILADMTTPELTQTLIASSNETLVQIVPRYIAGEVALSTQSVVAARTDRSPLPTYSRKLTKNDGVIDWHKPAVQLEREIRAFAGWPKSRANFGGLEVIITMAHVVNNTGNAGAPTIIGQQPLVYCGEQALAIDRLKPAGKQAMSGGAFLAGYRKLFLGN